MLSDFKIHKITVAKKELQQALQKAKEKHQQSQAFQALPKRKSLWQKIKAWFLS